MPRHNITMIAASTRNRGKRVRENKCNTALDGGRRAFVDFQVTPPLGSSMSLRGANLCHRPTGRNPGNERHGR